MKTLQTTRESLASALASIKAVIPKRSHIPILATVHICASESGAKIIGTDLDAEITARLEGATIDAGFSACLPLHSLEDMAKKSPKGCDVVISATGEEAPAQIRLGSIRATLNARASIDFPVNAFEGEVKAEFEICAREFGETLKACALAMSTEETRYYLNGVFMHPMTREDGKTVLRIVATDGHKLARLEFPADCDADWPGVIIPRATVAILMKQCLAKGAPQSIRVKINTQKVLFTLGNLSILSKLVDGTFPDYARVIPGILDRRATFDRSKFLAALRSVTTISSERGRAVALQFEDSRVKLTVSNPDTGATSAEVSCEFEGEPFFIGFAGRYLEEILTADDSETVTFFMANDGGPIRIARYDGAYNFYILMPMRASNKTPEELAAELEARAKAKAKRDFYARIAEMAEEETQAKIARAVAETAPKVIALAQALARVAPHIRAGHVARFTIKSGAPHSEAPIYDALALARWLVDNGAHKPDLAAPVAAPAEMPADKNEMKSACVAAWDDKIAALDKIAPVPAAAPLVAAAPKPRIRFFFNGLKTTDERNLQRALYSFQNYEDPRCKTPKGTITIYARNYKRFSAAVREAFAVKNESDGMTDYFEEDRFDVVPSHPLYSRVLAGYEAQKVWREGVDERRRLKSSLRRAA